MPLRKDHLRLVTDAGAALDLGWDYQLPYTMDPLNGVDVDLQKAQGVHIYSQARNLHCAEEAGCCDPSSLDITPEDLAASETVTVVWSLSDSEHKE